MIRAWSASVPAVRFQMWMRCPAEELGSDEEGGFGDVVPDKLAEARVVVRMVEVRDEKLSVPVMREWGNVAMDCSVGLSCLGVSVSALSGAVGD
jgi:hypothetical protein